MVRVAGRVELAIHGGNGDAEFFRIDRGELRNIVGERSVRVGEMACITRREDVFDAEPRLRLFQFGVHSPSIGE